MAVHRFFILAVAALPWFCSDATAQTWGGYRDWDRNSDGYITRAEWRGSLQDFRALDLNRDGVLSAAELRDEQQWEPADDENWDAQSFASLDRNHNGRITRGEWRGDVATFRRIDRNRDNQITRAEFLNANVDYDADVDITDFTELDYDGDQRIVRSEWTGTRATFERLDRDGSGWLSQREFANNTADAAGHTDFDAIDANNNGVITASEWRYGYGVGNFNQYDDNRDGVISRAEYANVNAGVGNAETAIVVDSREPWTHTGIHVTPGDLVIYRVEGTIQMSDNPNDRATAAGALSGRTARNSPRPDQKAGGLLMRVDNAPVTFAGESGSFTAQQGGQLLLGVNDDHLLDNTGEYRVWISVSRR